VLFDVLVCPDCKNRLVCEPAVVYGDDIMEGRLTCPDWPAAALSGSVRVAALS